MNRCISKGSLTTLYYLFHKIIDHLVAALYVDMDGLQQIKSLSMDSQNRIIYLPLNRSFADAIILQYLNMYKDLQIGYFFACQEDNLNLKPLHQIYKYIGMTLPQR